MSQKICIISFDHWNYDKHIVDKLNEKGIEAFHIKIGGFKHKNISSRIANTFSKIFLDKNPKTKKRQEHIIEMLEKKGFQDQILIINPEVIDIEYHNKIKKYTTKYIAYLYDSVERNPVEHLLNDLFHEIYSFDKEDVKKFDFKETTNYNYIKTKLDVAYKKPLLDIIYVTSFDKRIEKLAPIAADLVEKNIKFNFIIAGKKATVFNLKKIFTNKFNHLNFRKKRINQTELLELYTQSKVILDLARENQTGLSFRVFEAMGLEKKLITDNVIIKEYPFYNPNNILVIANEKNDFDVRFFETQYEPLSEEIYYIYTLDNWVNKIFNLNK